MKIKELGDIQSNLNPIPMDNSFWIQENIARQHSAPGIRTGNTFGTTIT